MARYFRRRRVRTALRSYRRRRRFSRRRYRPRRGLKRVYRRLRGLSRRMRRTSDIRCNYGSVGLAAIPNTWASPGGFIEFTDLTQATTTNEAASSVTSTVPAYRTGQTVLLKYVKVRIVLRNTNLAGQGTAGLFRIFVVKFRKQNQQTETDLRSLFLTDTDPLSSLAWDELKQGAWDIKMDKTVSYPGMGMATVADGVKEKNIEFVIPCGWRVNYDGSNNTISGALYMQVCGTGLGYYEVRHQTIFDDTA